MVNASGVTVSPRATANLKRSLVLAMVCGGVLLVLLALLGHPLAGLFVVIGLGFGVVNARLVQRAVVAYGANQRKGGFVAQMLARLALLTVVSLLAVIFVRPDGAGLLAGIAIFQVIMLLGAAIPVLRELRR